LGFSNRWYPEAARTAARVRLNDRVEIRRISAPAFVATKLEAFLDRGRGDPLSSHDLEDVLAVVDGRPSIVDELRTATPDLRQFVRETIGALLSQARFENYLPGLLADNSRANIVMERLKGLVS
jgi:predicted nucleotidyltransferase